MATLTVLRNAVYSKLGMDSTSSGNDETLVTSWLNEGVREVLLRTHCYVGETTISLSANTWKYTLDASILAMLHVTDDENRPVEVIQATDLLDLRRASTSTDAVPLRIAVLGSNKLLVWPTPTASSTLDVLYVPKPTEMSTGSHDPSNATYGGVPVEFHKAIELWALAQGSDYEHEGRTQSGVKYMQEFELYVKGVIRPAVNRKAGRLGRVKVGRRPLAATGNGTYPRY